MGKHIEDSATGEDELYDLSVGPREADNVIEAHPDVVGRFKELAMEHREERERLGGLNRAARRARPPRR